MGDGDKAIIAADVSKRFRLYNDRRNSLKERFVRRPAGPRHEDFWALRDVSLEVETGSMYGLIGHNGSGKSTLLKLMAGIHRPTSGRITHTGRVSALLELGAGFHPELSGRDNIYLNGSILGLTKRQIDAALDQIVDFSGLGSFIDTPVKVYSSGMYVRLGFSIAVNLDPEILIIDEIIAVGDEEFQRRCFDHLFELRRKGVTIVFVTHSLPLVQTLCDEVAWLDHGRLREKGAAAVVTQAYLREVNAAEVHATEATSSGTDGDASKRAVPEAPPEHTRQGTHEIVVTRVEFVDPSGRAGNRVVAGVPLRIRMHYEAREAVDRPVFGIGISTENATYITGDHTRAHDLDLGTVTGTGYVDHVLDPMPLNPGTYRLSVGLTDWSLGHRYDYWDHGVELHVRQGDAAEYHGTVRLGGRWETSRPAAVGAP